MFRALGATKQKGAQQLDVRPDDTDSRDYIFSPTIALLPETFDPRSRGRPFVLNQRGEGACVGHALAAVINASLLRRHGTKSASSSAARTRKQRTIPQDLLVSERMLYEMGRRYDEWTGERYEGTSLRGAMKGWHKHGVCARSLWQYEPGGAPGSLTTERAGDAKRRPLGSYFRILDSDVSHVQAAIFEGDAVLASAWIHGGWRQGRLRPQGSLGIHQIDPDPRVVGLHAFALIGYCPAGFIVQNSWGDEWGSDGLAIMCYSDWFANRQDAWVARPGPQTWDCSGKPAIFLGPFAGDKAGTESGMAGTTGTEGLGVEPESLAYMINTGDRGKLSQDGRLVTREQDFPEMAARVLLTPVKSGHVRDVVLYAHGGLVSETSAAQTASRLWKYCRNRNPKLTAYFFVWESGLKEGFLGMLRSQDDAMGPRAGFDIGAIVDKVKKSVEEQLRQAQIKLGKGIAHLGKGFWDEVKGRAQGATTRSGGAGLFMQQLFQAMESATGAPFRLHLVGHSAGSILLSRLYQQFLASKLQSTNRVRLGSIQFMAPAISVPLAKEILGPLDRLPNPPMFRVFTLSKADEESDGIVIYPSSVLTYIADHLEKGPGQRVPLLGIETDLKKTLSSVGNPLPVQADVSTHHTEFDDPGHEVETILESIARM